MKTDPNKGCANEKENMLWAFIHDAIAHPLMALTDYSFWSIRFHDYTSHHAWPRAKKVSTQFYTRIYAKNDTDMLILQHIEEGFRKAGVSFVTEGFHTSAHGYVYDVSIIHWNKPNG